MNQTQAALQALPSDLITKLCRSKVTRLSLKQMYTLGRHVLESKSQGAFVIPAVFLHQELPIRMSHALSMLNNSSGLLPVNVAAMPTFQNIARSYLEDISLMTQIPKPSTPHLEEQFTALLCDLEQRHALKMLTIDQGIKELIMALQNHRLAQMNGAWTRGFTVGRSSNSNAPCPEDAAAIQSFFNQFYTINLGTRLLIGEHLALKFSNENLVKRLNPLKISQNAIKDAQSEFTALYSTASGVTQTARAIPSVEIHKLGSSPTEISATYVEEFLHFNITELLKKAMRATCEAHQSKLEGDPWTLSMGLTSALSTSSSLWSKKSKATTRTAKRSMLPPIRLTLVHGEEDVSIKITDEGGGFALSELGRIWNFANASQTSPPLTALVTEPCSTSLPSSSPLPFKISIGRGLPLARLIARYFGGDLTVVPLEGHGTDSYLSLCRNDDHLENIPEFGTEMSEEVDVFVSELLDRSLARNSTAPPLTTTRALKGTLSSGLPVSAPSATTADAGAPSRPPSSPSMPASMLLGLGKTSSLANNSAAAALLLARRGPFLPPSSPTSSQSISPTL